MLNFLRKLRQKEFKGSYIKYALGEIILVVIGILIALSINNWNEIRKQKIVQKAMLKKFSQDLIEDYNNYQTYSFEISQIDSLHQSLFYMILSKGASELKQPELIRRSVFFNPVSKDNNPDITTEINNEDVRKSIQTYFKDINETRNSVLEYRAVIVEMRDYLRKKEMHNFEDWANSRQFTNVISKENLSMLAQERFFQQLLFEASLKLNEVEGELKDLMTSNKETTENVLHHLKNK